LAGNECGCPEERYTWQKHSRGCRSRGVSILAAECYSCWKFGKDNQNVECVVLVVLVSLPFVCQEFQHTVARSAYGLRQFLEGEVDENFTFRLLM
jgi:hypothetical protein